MAEVNRRRFLQLAGATTAFSALSASIDRAAALPANHRSGSIEDVEHIVVLMQENRSFDHYFGTLRGVRGFGDPHPVRLDDGRSVWHQRKGDGTEVLPFHPEADDLGMQFLEGLPHGWSDGQDAYHDAKYDRWLPAKGTTTMAYLTREDIPFHYALADTFTVCDAYHCSFIGSTDPNRYYLWSGHTGNDGAGGGPVLGNDELGYDWTTYPERLEAAGSPGRSTRTSATASTRPATGAGSTTPTGATTATTPCCTSTSTGTRSPATRCTTRPAPAPTRSAARATSTGSVPTSRRASCRRSPG